MKRISSLAIVALVLGLTAPAAADVVFEESALRESLGRDATGSETDPLFHEAWELFAGSIEGDRILSKLESRRDVEVRIEIVDEIVDEGERAYGLATLFKLPNDDGQMRITIQISRGHKGTATGLAETYYHEFRHAELYADDLDDGHDVLHADDDPRMHAFREQTVTPVLVDRTPIYDEIAAKAAEQRDLRATSIRFADALNDHVHLDLDQSPTFTGDEVDIVGFTSIESATSASLVDLTDAAEPSGTDERCEQDGATGAVVCGASAEALDNAGGEFHFVGMKLGAMVPLEGFGQEIEFVLAVDSDGDPANNHAGRSRYENDPAAGTDRWITFSFDANTDGWRFRVWQVGDSGTGVNIDREAAEIGVIEGDTVMFALPPSGYTDPRFRLYTLTHDGSFGGSIGMDVLGTLPTDPLVGLDGRRFGGTPTATAMNGRGDLILYFGPATIVQHEDFIADFCVERNGSPLPEGHEVATTLGDPPSGATATHAQGMIDAVGCVSMRLPVLEPPGDSFLFLFDGEEVVPIEVIPILRPTVLADDDP